MTRSMLLLGMTVGVAVALIEGADSRGADAGGAEQALSALVGAERAFAKMSVDTTQRDAFLANFADDGVWFRPAPAVARGDLLKPPSPPGPTPVLDWDPLTGDVAASGDLGYTTGPWISSERGQEGAPGRKLGTGWFFSVWRRTVGGWKVAADFGVGAPHSRVLRGETFRRSGVRSTVPDARGDATRWSGELRAADLELGKRVAGVGWAQALEVGATADVRIYRDGHEPSAGPASAAAFLPAGPRPGQCTPSFTRASSAGDLGYTYGAYTDLGGATPVHGYYLRVWKRLAGGWKLAADVANVEERPR